MLIKFQVPNHITISVKAGLEELALTQQALFHISFLPGDPN